MSNRGEAPSLRAVPPATAGELFRLIREGAATTRPQLGRAPRPPPTALAGPGAAPPRAGTRARPLANGDRGRGRGAARSPARPRDRGAWPGRRLGGRPTTRPPV